MLSNAYFLAQFHFDTAENEPAKMLQNSAKKIAEFANFASFANPNPNLTLTTRSGSDARVQRRHAAAHAEVHRLKQSTTEQRQPWQLKITAEYNYQDIIQ